MSHVTHMNKSRTPRLEADWLQVVRVRDEFTCVMEFVTDSCV